MKWNGRNYRPAGQYIRHSKNNKEFNFEDALKPLGEKESKGNIWVPVKQVIMNVPQTTSSVPVSPTPTPSITPTNTQTPTPSITPTQTITPTNTGTPTQTPTNTGTPTNTPTNTGSPTPTPSNLASGTTEANAYLSAVVSAGGTGITPTISAATRTLFTSLVSNGLYNKIVAMYPMLGGNSAGCKFNAKNPVDTNAAMRLTFAGGWTFSSKGALPNGTNAFANTMLGFNTIVSANNWHLSFYSQTSGTSAGVDMGVGRSDTAERLADLQLRTNTNTAIFDATTTGIFAGRITATGITSGTGYYIGSITSASDRRYYKNGSEIASSTSNISNTLSTFSLFIGALSDEFTPNVSAYSNKECSFSTIGSGLTPAEMTTLSSIVNTWATAIGRNTY